MSRLRNLPNSGSAYYYVAVNPKSKPYFGVIRTRLDIHSFIFIPSFLWIRRGDSSSPSRTIVPHRDVDTKPGEAIAPPIPKVVLTIFKLIKVLMRKRKMQKNASVQVNETA